MSHSHLVIIHDILTSKTLYPHVKKMLILGYKRLVLHNYYDVYGRDELKDYPNNVYNVILSTNLRRLPRDSLQALTAIKIFRTEALIEKILIDGYKGDILALRTFYDKYSLYSSTYTKKSLMEKLGTYIKTSIEK